MHKLQGLDGQAPRGGVIAVLQGPSQLSLAGCSLASNQAEGDGGALSLAGPGSALEAAGCNFTDNTAGADGGCVWAANALAVALSGSTFTRGAAWGRGGALALTGCPSATLDGVALDLCTSASGGGAVYAAGTHLTVGYWNLLLARLSAPLRADAAPLTF